MHKVNWDDFRVVLAVCEAGSVNGAAKRLGLNHATILRRVAAFEDRHSVSIFSKSGRGYKLNPDSGRILNSLRSLDHAVIELERRLQGHGSSVTGTVRVTTTDSLTDRILPELVVDLCKKQQGLSVSLITTNNPLNLNKTEADIAVRATTRAPDGLVCMPVGSLGFGIYRRILRRSGTNGDRPWIRRTGLSHKLPVSRWQERMIDNGPVAAQADTFSAMANLIALGAGAGMLPCVLGDRTKGIERVALMPEDMATPVWVACHADMINLPHIRATFDFLCDGLQASQDELAGVRG